VLSSCQGVDDDVADKPASHIVTEMRKRRKKEERVEMKRKEINGIDRYQGREIILNDCLDDGFCVWPKRVN